MQIASWQKNKAAKDDQTALMTALNPLELPELTNREIQDWKLDLRYYDSLKVPYKACWDMATRFLRVVGLTQKLPSPLGTVKQDSNWECGYFVRYYCEEEIRVAVVKLLGLVVQLEG